VCRPSGTRVLLLFTGDFRPRLQVMPSLPTPISANPALLGDPGFGTAATHMLSQASAHHRLADAAQEIKASLSKWMCKRFA